MRNICDMCLAQIEGTWRYTEKCFNDFYYEDGDPCKKNESFFNKLITRVTNFFKGIISAFARLFGKADNTNIKMPDEKQVYMHKNFDAIVKCDEATREKLKNCKTAEDCEKIMAEYKSKRSKLNKAIKTGATVLGIAIPAAIAYKWCKKSKSIQNDLEKENRELVHQLESMKKASVNNTANTLDLVKVNKIYEAMLNVVKNKSETEGEKFKDLWNQCLDVKDELDKKLPSGKEAANYIAYGKGGKKLS